MDSRRDLTQMCSRWLQSPSEVLVAGSRALFSSRGRLDIERDVRSFRGLAADLAFAAEQRVAAGVVGSAEGVAGRRDRRSRRGERGARAAGRAGRAQNAKIR